MAVQIPTLQRFNPAETPSVGRTEQTPVDQATPMKVEAEAVTKLGSTISEAIYVQQKHAAEVEANRASSEYALWMDQQLNGKPAGPNGEPPVIGLRHQKGNPAPLYAKLEEDKIKFKQSLLEKYQNSIGLVKEHVGTSLDHIEQQYAGNVSSSYGHQQSVYDTESTAESVKVTRRLTIDKLAEYNPKNPLKPTDEELNTFQGGLNINRKKITDYSVRVGMDVEKDPQVLTRLQKEESETLEEGLNLLLSAQQPDKAQGLYDRYKENIDPAKRDNIEKDIRETRDSVKAYELFGKARIKKHPEAFAEIMNSKESEEVKSKARKLLSTYRTELENMEKDRRDDGVTLLYDDIRKRQRSDKPYVDGNQMERENDEIIRRFKLGPEQVRSLKSMIEPPKESNEDAAVLAFNLMKNSFLPYSETGEKSGLKGMSYPKLIELSADLNERDKGQLFKSYTDVNVQKPPDEARQQMEVLNKLESSLLSLGLTNKEVGINEIGRKKGNYSKKDKEKLREWTRDIISDLESREVMSEKDQQLYIDRRIKEKIDAQPKPKGTWDSFKEAIGITPSVSSPKSTTTTTTLAPPPEPSGSNVPGVSEGKDAIKRKKDAYDLFRAKYHRSPSKQELQQFMKEQ